MHNVAQCSDFLAVFCLDCLHISQPRCAVDRLYKAEDKWGTLSVARSGLFPRSIASWLPSTGTLHADARVYPRSCFRRDKSKNNIGEELYKRGGGRSWQKGKRWDSMRPVSHQNNPWRQGAEKWIVGVRESGSVGGVYLACMPLSGTCPQCQHIQNRDRRNRTPRLLSATYQVQDHPVLHKT